MPQPIKIGQIGTGHAHARGKMQSLRRSDDYEVVGVVEPNPVLRKQAEQNPVYKNVRWMTEEQLLNVAGLKVVAVETEVKNLLDTGARAVAAGKHIHLDKPAGEDFPKFKKLLDNATRQHLTVQMGYMFRYNPGFTFIVKAVRDGWLGDIFSIHTVMSKTVGIATRKELSEYRGGTMFELGCHIIDSVVRFLGKPDRVVPFARHFANLDDDLLDNQLAVFEYPRATVTVRSALMEVDGFARRQFVVCGDVGPADLRPLEPPKLQLALSRPRGKFKKGYQDVPIKNLPRYDADFVDLAKVIRSEKEFEFTPEHDLAVQEAILLASGMPTT